jgi:hypothetical protein
VRAHLVTSFRRRCCRGAGCPARANSDPSLFDIARVDAISCGERSRRSSTTRREKSAGLECSIRYSLSAAGVLPSGVMLESDRAEEQLARVQQLLEALQREAAAKRSSAERVGPSSSDSFSSPPGAPAVSVPSPGEPSEVPQ